MLRQHCQSIHPDWLCITEPKIPINHIRSETKQIRTDGKKPSRFLSKWEEIRVSMSASSSLSHGGKRKVMRNNIKNIGGTPFFIPKLGCLDHRENKGSTEFPSSECPCLSDVEGGLMKGCGLHRGLLARIARDSVFFDGSRRGSRVEARGREALHQGKDQGEAPPYPPAELLAQSPRLPYISLRAPASTAPLTYDIPSVGKPSLKKEEDSASSGRSRSTSSVNQPIPREQAAGPSNAVPAPQPAAAPAAQQQNHLAAGPNNHEVVGGERVEDIARRLLSKSDNPSAMDIRLAEIQAEDLFQVKAEIINRMAILHPEGDWENRGARALENSRTLTGEESLERLYRLRDDIVQNGIHSENFRNLKLKVFLRDQNFDAQSQA
ncbi:hypothetical protein RIF29_43647 [Crotalaria pallida]|uniref:DUF8018 domain-containing protein n=1 Tax=Crotalaria pallida TaxID=3830 RepID=A0AAN9DSP3_CROPI